MTHLFVLLDEEAQVEARFGLLMQDRFTVCIEHTICLEINLDAPVGTSVKRLKWKLGLIYLEKVLILIQYRCMVCMDRTICLEINLDTLDRTP